MPEVLTPPRERSERRMRTCIRCNKPAINCMCNAPHIIEGNRTTPMEEGEAACKAGNGTASCPYEFGTDEFQQWINGYSLELSKVQEDYCIDKQIDY